MKISHAIRHGLDFLLLIVIVGLCLGGILYFSWDKAAQVAITLLFAILYVFWGVFHHYHDGDLAVKIVWEYVAMSAMVTFILITFLLRV